MIYRALRAYSGIGVAALTCFGLTSTPTYAKETKHWVVSWFTVASYSEAKDCPSGLNQPSVEVWANGMRALGLPESEVKAFFEGTMKDEDRQRVQQDYIRNRARIDGKPVNVYANPLAREFLKEEPRFNTTTSKWGFGFDLDGKGEGSPNGFEDPETHQRGIDNEYYRVMSCMITYQAKPPARPSNNALNFGGGYAWGQLREAMPAWLVSVSGEDLTRNGDVTVTFNRAYDPIHLDAGREPLANDTFRLDPDPRSENIYRGKLNNGVVTIEPAPDFRMLGDPYLLPEFNMRNVQLRFKIKPDGTLDGILGGYQPWIDIYWATANAGTGNEVANSMDSPTLYVMLRKFADALPDPKSGENSHISISWHIEAVPALVVPATPAKGRKAASAR